VLTRIVVALVRISTRFATVTVLIALAAAIAATIFAARNFAINTDINQLISNKLEWRQRDLAFDKAFPDQHHSILAVVEAPTAEFVSRASNLLADRLAADKTHFIAVTPLGSGPFFEKNGLLYLPTAEVAKLTAELTTGRPLLEVLAGDPSLRGLTGALEAGLQGLKRGELGPDAVAKPFNTVADTLETVLAGKPAVFSWRELTSDQPLTASDKRSFIQVNPVLHFDELEPGRDATDAIRKAAADLHLASAYGATVRLTGPIPIANDEFGSVQENAVTNAVGTVVIVLLILWAALHSAKIIFAVFVTLFMGLAITTAVGLAMVGALNLISVAFAVLFIGIGVDFGIQYSVRYRSERFKQDDLERALLRAAKRLAIPLSLAAAATTLGFVSFLPTDYVGVSELGKIAGVGMVVAFLVSITVLPAMLKLLNPAGEKEPVGYLWLAPVDIFLEKHRVAIIVCTLLATIAGLPLLHYLRFDFNPINLRNPHVESVATYLDLRKDPATGASAVSVIAPNEAAVKRIEARLAAVPEVAETRSLDMLIPADQPAKLAMIRKAAETLTPALNPEDVDPPPSDEDNVAALNDTADSLRKALSGAQGPGADASRRLADAMSKLAAADATTRVKAEDVLVTPLKIMLDQMKSALQAEPVTAGTLPPALLRSWRAEDGRIRVEALPKGDPNDNETLRRFADAVLAAEPTAIGGPVSILKSGETIVNAFIQAGIWALITIALLLWVVLRRFTDVLLTIVPLMVAGIVTLEICVLIGLPMNFANIIALPLLMGIGVAFKIYYVTAWRAGKIHLLQSSLTRAIFFSALTTGTAFGSLWLSSHPGTASMGKLLALSLVTTLAAVLLFQPALMGPPRNLGK
jgi:hopanoid biosynthesis associated RND transporter like protein HpnN